MAAPGSYELDLEPGAALDGKLVALGPDSGTTAVTGGTVLDGKGGRFEAATVIVRGMRIEAVLTGERSRAPVPAGARVIDARGLTVLPGMVDAHIHFMGNETRDPYRSHFVPTDEVRLIRAALEFYQTLASGFTTVRALGHGPAEHAYALRQAQIEGLIRGPRMLTSGWALSQTRGHGDVPELPYDWVEHERPRSAFCDGELECRIMARRNFGEGADVIKVYTTDNRTGRPDFTIAELEAIADEAHRRGKRVASHAKSYEGVRNALLAGIDTIEHGPPEPHADLLELMASRGATLVPTMATVYRVAVEGKDWGVAPAAMERAKRELDGRQRVARAASELGIRIATGSDAGGRAGFGLLSARELALLVDSGLTPMQAIVAATGSGAAALGLDADVGTVAAGKLADLVVVAGDPLADITLFQAPSHIRYILQAQDPLIF